MTTMQLSQQQTVERASKHVEFFVLCFPVGVPFTDTVKAKTARGALRKTRTNHPNLKGVKVFASQDDFPDGGCVLSWESPAFKAHLHGFKCPFCTHGKARGGVHLSIKPWATEVRAEEYTCDSCKRKIYVTSPPH
jgi:hypothetical protein